MTKERKLKFALWYIIFLTAVALALAVDLFISDRHAFGGS